MKAAPLFVFALLWGGSLLAQSEICDNGRDDDGDGLIDLNDPDCVCEIIEPVSVIPNPSFEDQDCCPSSRSQLDCASLWIQASAPTTDYINTCGWLGWPEFPPPRPFPDGEGIMGFRDGRVRRNTSAAETNWKEYAGACLVTPLEAGTTYRFQFDVGFVDAVQSPPLAITFFGTADCADLPFGGNDEAFGCPTNGPDWSKLGEVRVSGDGANAWVNTSIEFTPAENIAAIAIGPPCSATVSPVSTYYFFDNLLLADLASFTFRISEVEHPCQDDFTLAVPTNPNLDYQWYRDGVALPGEITPQLSRNYGEGSYVVRILDGESCRISTTYDYAVPIIIRTPTVAICEGDTYALGDAELTTSGFYSDTLVSVNGCDSIVQLNLQVIGSVYDTVAVSINNGGVFPIADQELSRPGENRLTLTSSLGCDSLVLVEITTYDVFLPDAFSPNRDGVNDLFRPFAPFGEIQSVDLRVYDRWGGLVYEGEAWDGKDAEVGVYVYVVDIGFSYGNSRRYVGAVTLLR